MVTKSYRHGTEEGSKLCKPPCVNCARWLETGMEDIPVTDTNPTLMRIGGPPPPLTSSPDIISFLHSGRFNQIHIEMLGQEWAAEIKAHGDKFVGFGISPDYALFAAIKRLYGSEPDTGPITVTVDQTTHETSQGHALDEEDTVGIERIWAENDSENSSDRFGDGDGNT